MRSTVADVLARRAAGLMQRAAERANRVRREERLVRTLVAELKQPLFDAHAALAATDPSGKVAARVVAGEALTRLTERLAALAAAPDHAADSGGDALASLGLGSREIATSEPVEVGAALVCDRDRDHRKQLSALLHAAGIERASILEAELDSALIDTVVDGEIELVVLGVRGDSRLELEVIDQLVGLTSPPAIVVAATHVTETLRIHALALGAHEVVEKGAIAPHVLYGVLASAQLRAERAAHERSLLKHVEQRARELEEHAQVVSHDLKQPLSVLALDLSRIEAQLLRRGSDLVGEVRESCNEVRKLSSMIDDLLSVARAEHDALKLERVDLGVLVRNCIASHASELDAIGAVVAVDALPAVLATPALMEQVVRNLIANAIRYRSAAPLMLNVTCRTHAQHYELSFADNGVGVPAGSQEMIFGVFQRASEVSGGSGIGLAICRRIVERHGGRIWVEDSAEGGARFVVALPRNRRRAMR
ncbi:MAG: HAMP domain-containing sensor histidine kinase [Planctomycetota bacterium]